MPQRHLFACENPKFIINELPLHDAQAHPSHAHVFHAKPYAARKPQKYASALRNEFASNFVFPEKNY